MERQVYVKDHVRQVPLDYRSCVKEVDLCWMMKWVHLKLNTNKKKKQERLENMLRKKKYENNNME